MLLSIVGNALIIRQIDRAQWCSGSYFSMLFQLAAIESINRILVKEVCKNAKK